jgi:hybrid cluster-associated redox disulfide protein
MENKTKTIQANGKKAITGKMTFGEILKNNPESVEVLFNNGLHCIGCGMAMYETLEEGCQAHGMSKKEIDELIKKLNKKNKEK